MHNEKFSRRNDKILTQNQHTIYYTFGQLTEKSKNEENYSVLMKAIS